MTPRAAPSAPSDPPLGAGARTARPGGCSSGRPCSSSSFCRSSRSSRRSTLAFSQLVFDAGRRRDRLRRLRELPALLFGTERSHFLGLLRPPNPLGWADRWRRRHGRGRLVAGPPRRPGAARSGSVLRLSPARSFVGFVWLLVADRQRGRPAGRADRDDDLRRRRHRAPVPARAGPGAPGRPARARRRFFRVVFLIPLTITPVGVGYMFRMMTDTSKGPVEPIWVALGLQRLHLGDRPVGGARRGDHRRHLAVDPVHVHRPAGRPREPRPGGPRGRLGGRRAAGGRASATSRSRRSCR